MVPVPDGCHGSCYGRPVKGIGVETVFDSFQGVDEIFMPQGKPHPESGQGAGFGEGLDYQKVGESVYQGHG